MGYVLAGILASLLMLMYRRPPARTSPLWQVSSGGSLLARRFETDPSPIASAIGLVGSFLVLFIIAASRYGIGTDYWSRHIPVFDQIKAGYEVDYEPGFVLLNQMVGIFTGDGQWLIAALSLITLLLVYRFIVRMSFNPAISVFVFVFGGFYLEVFNLAQQGLAIAVLLNTIELGLRRKHFSFLLLTLLAVTVHSSSLIWLAVWPFLVFRLGRSWRLFGSVVAALVVMLIPSALISVVEYSTPDYAWYLQSDYGNARTINFGVVLVSVALASLLMVFVRRGGTKDRYPDAIVNLVVIGVLVLVSATTVAYFFSRLIYFFSPVQIVALPLLLSTFSDKIIRAFVCVLFVLLYLVAFVLQFIIWNAHGVMPYDSIIFGN